MTRVQRERFFNEEDYVRLKDSYILDMEKMANAKPDMAILHPLPRVNEIAVEVDNDPRAAYFKQVQYLSLIHICQCGDRFLWYVWPLPHQNREYFRIQKY